MAWNTCFARHYGVDLVVVHMGSIGPHIKATVTTGIIEVSLSSRQNPIISSFSFLHSWSQLCWLFAHDWCGLVRNYNSSNHINTNNLTIVLVAMVLPPSDVLLRMVVVSFLTRRRGDAGCVYLTTSTGHTVGRTRYRHCVTGTINPKSLLHQAVLTCHSHESSFWSPFLSQITTWFYFWSSLLITSYIPSYITAYCITHPIIHTHMNYSPCPLFQITTRFYFWSSLLIFLVSLGGYVYVEGVEVQGMTIHVEGSDTHSSFVIPYYHHRYNLIC